MRILVTGGAGFIGSHIAAHYASKATVRVLDNLRSGYRANLNGLDIEFMEGSVTDRPAVKKAVQGVDYVFHLAAMISVPESMENPTECVEINTQGTLNVLQEAASAGVKKLCFSSSAAIYGDNPTVPKTETMLPEPKSPYAVTKLDGEYYCGMFANEGWLQTACMRYFNVFGPRQDPKSQYAAAIPIFIHKALRHEPVTIFGDGLQTRDFIYVKDVVAANAYLAENSALTGVYNVAYGQRQTIHALAQMILDLTGSKSTLEYAPPRAGDVKHSQADIHRLKSTGYTPTSDFSGGLQQTIDFFKSTLGASY
jgi:UDP-glucose 4-epimerase